MFGNIVVHFVVFRNMFQMRPAAYFANSFTYRSHVSCHSIHLSVNFHLKLFTCRNVCLYVVALSDHGLHYSDITHVVCSHGHSDHVGNLGLFPDALLIVSYDICRGDTYYITGLYSVSVCSSSFNNNNNVNNKFLVI